MMRMRMSSPRRDFFFFVCAILFAIPTLAFAFPFGGQIGAGGASCPGDPAPLINCYNSAIYAQLGPPIGGQYIWTPSTQTYLFGAPSHAGQWLLGLAQVPYYCVASISPVIVCPGTAISMMGSSQ
jgi:hypothetical protein